MVKRKPRGRKIKNGAEKVKKSPQSTRKPLLVGYMRVSTDKQDHALQYDALIKENVAPENIFQDTITGSKINRDGLKLCLKFLIKGDVLIVWKMDRLSRSTRDFLNFIHKLGEMGVGFKSVTENIDTTTPTGRMQMQMTIMVAEMERENIRQRVKAGIKAKMNAGRYRWGKMPKSDYSDKEIRFLRKEGLSYRRIAKEVGVSVATVCRVLNKNKKGN